ncbi:hypothetical protein F7725_017765 [Dissostichus mawsoni]|uniref:Uncharacterized protein n=1 Tax=Dissostichus mawsoni TaxID=36200 RepID=A0A7J5XSH6_DISMA|nr:hypothetical protein F7725_017765 [Dissostichus mawsoni]
MDQLLLLLLLSSVSDRGVRRSGDSRRWELAASSVVPPNINCFSPNISVSSSMYGVSGAPAAGVPGVQRLLLQHQLLHPASVPRRLLPAQLHLHQLSKQLRLRASCQSLCPLPVPAAEPAHQGNYSCVYHVSAFSHNFSSESRLLSVTVTSVTVTSVTVTLLLKSACKGKKKIPVSLQVVASSGKTGTLQVVASSGKTGALQVVASSGKTGTLQVVACSGKTGTLQVVASSGKTGTLQVVASSGKTGTLQVVASSGKTGTLQVVASSGKTGTLQV